MPIIGLTGAVGAGKSTVRAWLAGQGAATVDADAVVHWLLSNDLAIMRTVAHEFGPSSPGDPTWPNEVDGVRPIDRAALASRVFSDPDALARLEAILHPAVNARLRALIDERVASGGHPGPVIVVEGVKLIESGFHRSCSQVWVVTCRVAERRQRLRRRGWNDETIAARLAASPRFVTHLAEADEVIDNSGPWTATVAQLEAAWARLVGVPPDTASGADRDPEPPADYHSAVGTSTGAGPHGERA